MFEVVSVALVGCSAIRVWCGRVVFSALWALCGMAQRVVSGEMCCIELWCGEITSVTLFQRVRESQKNCCRHQIHANKHVHMFHKIGR